MSIYFADRPISFTAASGAAVSHTGDTVDTTKVTVTIPGGSLGVNGIIEIWIRLSMPSSANAKTVRIKYGGTSFVATTYTTSVTGQQVSRISNRNSLTSQVGGPLSFSGIGGTAGAVVAGAINTAAAQDVLISLQVASAAETLTLEDYQISCWR